VNPPPGSDWNEIVDPVVSSIVRNKFHVSLSKLDGGRENQRALDVVQNIFLELTKAMDNHGEDIRDVKSYAAKVSYTECAKALGGGPRGRLKNKIRYFLENESGFAVWEGIEGDLHCGYAGWAAREAAPAASVNALTADPSNVMAKISSNAVKDLDSMKARDWRNLMEGIFEFLGGPVELDDVLAIACSLFKVKDLPPEAPERSHIPRPDVDLHNKDTMRRLWRILQHLGKHRWLMAFLLNLPGMTKEARGEIEVFEEVASRGEIGRLLGLTETEYKFLRERMAQLPADPGSPEGRLEMLWPHLPLEDISIAAAMQCQKQQVTNLRQVALQKIAKRLKDPARERN